MRNILLLILGGWLATCGPSQTHAQSTPSSGSELTLLPGDMLQIRIWREPDLSGEFLIDETGSVILPMLGRRTVSGMPFVELRDALLADYRGQLRNPSISILPLRRIFILGEVNKPGLYSADPTISLAGAIALAGGANSMGELRRVRLVRDGHVVQDKLPSEAAMTSIDVRSGDQIFVGRRSWVERNSTFLVSAVLAATSVLVTLVK